jgi:hypothetical protein
MSIKMMAASLTYKRELEAVFEAGLKEYSIQNQLDKILKAMQAPQVQVSMDFHENIQHVIESNPQRWN